MDNLDLIHANPFLAAMRSYISDSPFNTAIPRRINAIQAVVTELLKENEREYADMFLKVLSDRVFKLFPELAIKGPAGIHGDEKNCIFRFACNNLVTETEFVLVLERAALLWEEVDGRSDEIILKAKDDKNSSFMEYNVDTDNDRNLESNEVYIKCIETIAAMLEVLNNPQVIGYQSNRGLRLMMPSELQKDVFNYVEGGFESLSIMQFLRDFPCHQQVWTEMYYQLVHVISNIDFRPKSIYDAPLQDFSERTDIDIEIFIAVLEDAIKNTETLIWTPTFGPPPLPPGNEMSPMFVFDEENDYCGY